MTREETQDFLAYIAGKYPNFKPESRTLTINAWQHDLEEYSLDECYTAAKIYGSTNKTGFAPNTDQLIDALHKVQDFAQLNEVEAWAKVSAAIRRSAYHAQEEFDKLADFPLIQKALGPSGPAQLHNWSQTSLDILESSVMKTFCITYQRLAKEQREYNRMPLEARQQIDALTAATLKQLPKWENPVPLVEAREQERASAEAIDNNLARLHDLLKVEA